MKFLGYTLFERITEQKTPEAKIVKNQFSRERPEKVTFEQLIHYHDLTPQIQIAISSYAELITGTELVVSANSDEAKKLLDDWIARTDFYRKFEGLVSTLLITGNALLERLDEKDTQNVEEVDMSTIISKERNLEGDKVLYYEQRQQSGQVVKLGENKPDRFIEFNLTNYSKQAWGRSLFYSLAVPRRVGENRVTAPLVEILWGMEDAMAGIIQNNAYPITTITYAGANDKFLEKEAERWRRYKPGDKRVQKIKGEIEFFETQPGSKYTDYVTHIQKTIELGTQFPHDILTGDFTSRASSETTETIVMKKVRGHQRYLCNKLIDELFGPILEQNGMNPEDEDLDVSFVAQNIKDLDVDQVLKLFKDNAISIKELREWLKTNTGLDLPDDNEIIQAVQDEKQMQKDRFEQEGQAMDAKVKDLESTIKGIAKDVAISEKLDQKISEIKKQIDENNQGVANKKIRKLEEIIKGILKDG